MKQSKHVHQHETRFDEGNLMVSLVAVQFSEPSNCGNERPFVGWERIIEQVRKTFYIFHSEPFKIQKVQTFCSPQNGFCHVLVKLMS
jgi:hypothetical protein